MNITPPELTLPLLGDMQRIARRDGLPSCVAFTITPEMAGTLLQGHANYRKPRQGKVDQYARDMKDGCWRLNGSTIVLTDHLDLVDAQHRLMACVKSGVPFESIVVVGIDPSATATMDTDLARNAALVLAANGVKNSTTVASAANAFIRTFAPGPSVSVSEQVEWVNNHPDIHYAASRCSRLTVKELRVPAGAAALFLMWAYDLDPDMTEQFVSAVATGADLAEDDPRFALRRFLIARSSDRQKPTRIFYLALLVKAWNAYVLDRPTKTVMWKRTEDFPVMVNTYGSPVDMSTLGTKP